MISNLPGDLLEEILFRVPLKFTRAVRLTCKKWNALFKSWNFTKMHIGKKEATARVLGQSRMIVMKDYNLYLTSVFVNENPSIEPQGKLSFLKTSEQVKISQVYHSEGLLLCILKDHTRVVVWNPYLGQTRWIQTRCTYRGQEAPNMYGYAIGYENKNKSCRSHKILRFIDGHIGGKKFFWYELYDFDSGFWTTLDVTGDWFIPYCQHGVSVKGNTYWWAAKENLGWQVICFDFSREKFVWILPLPFGVTNAGHVNLSCVGDGKLAVFVQDKIYTNRIEIWITTKIEANNMLWNKFLTVDTRLHITCWHFFVDEEKKVAMIIIDNKETVYIIGETGYSRELNLKIPSDGWLSVPFVCSYVPSLVEIKQHEGRKRKKQSDLEKHLYDKNMSRLVALEAVEAKWRKRRDDD